MVRSVCRHAGVERTSPKLPGLPQPEGATIFLRKSTSGLRPFDAVESSGTKFGKASIFWPSISSPKPLLSTREDGSLAATALKRFKIELCLCKTCIPVETLHRSPIKPLPLSTVGRSLRFEPRSNSTAWRFPQSITGCVS